MTLRALVPASAFALRGENRGPMLAVWYNILLLIASLIALPLDRRHILGLNPWIKPLKFEISVIVYLLTIAVLLTQLGRTGRWPRMRAFLGSFIGVAMIIENSIIAMQSLRGVRSHMNFTTLFDGVAFGIMGQFIAFNTVLVAILLYLYFVTNTGLPAPLTWGIRLGLFVLLAGSAEGVLIVTHGAHTGGAPDGLPGLPFVNWSTAHGDLRVPHFFALHALQLFTLCGWACSNLRARVTVQTAAVFAFAALYTGAVGLLFQQAIRGVPLLRR